MNSKERLRIHKLHYASLIEKIKDNKDLTNLIEGLISDLENYVKREEELFNIASQDLRLGENHILWIEYRDYKFKIYLDSERNTLVGDVLLNDEIDVVGLESDSITHLITEMERAVDNQISWKYQTKLAKEIIEKNSRIKKLEQELHSHLPSHLPKVIATLYCWTKEPEDEFIDEENITEKLDEELLVSLGLRDGSSKLTTISQIDYVSEFIESTIDLDTYDYFFEYHGDK